MPDIHDYTNQEHRGELARAGPGRQCSNKNNSILLYLGIIDAPIQWLTDTKYMLWLVIEKIQKEIPEIKRLIGQVKHENAASARAMMP